MGRRKLNLKTFVEAGANVLCLALLFSLSRGYAVGHVLERQDSGEVRVYVDPSRSRVVLYTTFTINVSIANAGGAGLYSYIFKLHFNNSLLQGIDVVLPENHFMTPQVPGNLFVVACWLNQTGGYAEVAMTLLDDEPAKVGNGTLAAANFRAKELGSSNLTISDCFLVDPYAQDHEQAMVVNGLVEIVLPDFNKDGRVDTSDLDIIREAFGSGKSDEKWNPACDVNNDGKINIVDVAVTAKAFGKVAPQ
jgi:hypothetical protein